MTKKKPKVSTATPINREAAAAARASFRENFPEADAELFPRTSPSGDNPNARAREIPWESALARWVELIAEGGLERAAAAKVCAEMGYPEITRDALRGRAVSDPVWKEALAMAHDTKIDTLERVVHTIATKENLQEEPAAVKNRLSAATAMLPKLDWERWGDRKRVEQEVTLKPPQDDTAIEVARDALALLSPEERAALLAEFGAHQIAAENEGAPRAGYKCPRCEYDAAGDIQFTEGA